MSFRQVGQALERIREASAGINAALEEQSRASTEIGDNITEAGRHSDKVNNRVDAIGAAAGQGEAVSRKLNDAAGILSEGSTHMKSRFNDFLSRIRSE